MNNLEQLQFENPYHRLPDEFFDRRMIQPFAGAHLISFSDSAAQLIGLSEQAATDEFVAVMTGNKSLSGMDPIGMCYSGHQFGGYVSRLGDGRALLLGQVRNQQGELWDLHLKGSGPTLYSRGGDGRAVLRSSIREYLCSEAMHGLGIATTRALCLLGGDERVMREQLEPAAMVVRMAQSHIRFGSFEYCFYTGKHDNLRRLADYVIEHFYPHLADSRNPYVALLFEVTEQTAALIASWQAVGFAHGVMNTDNMSILGLTLDYGPFGFLDTYDPAYICNHSDYQGRYAFGAQPDIGLFNISCLAQALLPLLADEEQEAMALAKQSFPHYRRSYQAHHAMHCRAKLGLLSENDSDEMLWDDLLDLMAGQVDFSRFFRALGDFDSQTAANNTPLRDMFLDRAAFDAWALRYAERLAAELSEDASRKLRMNSVNPRYILRNHMAETAIRRAEDHGDYTEINTLLNLLRRPYDEQPDMAGYDTFPPAWAQGISISCSS